jgi:outer membrane immunogenic protein
VLAEVDTFGAGQPTGTSIDGSTTYGIAGAFGGLNTGLNLQTGPVVLGLNAEINIASISGGTPWAFYGDPNDMVASSLRWFGSIAARVGLALGQVHIYGLAGWAAGNFTHTLTDTNALSVTVLHQGPTFGGGLEFATASGLVVGAEYRLYRFDTQSLDVPFDAVTYPSFWGDRLDFTPTVNTIRISISKLF